ncbi:MAG: zf-HC2 domain-containing protein [Planctomycetota bacterium]
MDRKKARELLMGYLDGELDEDDERAIEARLREDPELRRDEREFRRLKQLTDGIEFIEPTEAEWRQHWSFVYNRLERGIGWLLLSVGSLILLLTGAWYLLTDFFLDPEQPFLLRLGVGTAVAGGVFIGVSVARERIRIYRYDRYNEVEL